MNRALSSHTLKRKPPYDSSMLLLLIMHGLIIFGAMISVSCLAPETTLSQRKQVQQVLNQVFGSEDSRLFQERRQQALDVSSSDGADLHLPQHLTVYGELGLEALATVLDAVGVEKEDQFLDIGSGDGVLVAAAALLFHDHLQVARGLEILPTLHERSLLYQRRLHDVTKEAQVGFCPTELYLGNVYDPTNEVKGILKDTTLAVCFATTWSRGESGRRLLQLSKALGRAMPPKARIVLIDGRLSEQDGFRYGGELKIFCPDTAPFSLAHLYTRV